MAPIIRCMRFRSFRQVVLAKGDACQKVVVSAEIFGGGMDDNINSHIKRFDVVWRSQRGIYHGQ